MAVRERSEAAGGAAEDRGASEMGSGRATTPEVDLLFLSVRFCGPVHLRVNCIWGTNARLPFFT